MQGIYPLVSMDSGNASSQWGARTRPGHKGIFHSEAYPGLPHLQCLPSSFGLFASPILNTLGHIGMLKSQVFGSACASCSTHPTESSDECIEFNGPNKASQAPPGFAIISVPVTWWKSLPSRDGANEPDLTNGL